MNVLLCDLGEQRPPFRIKGDVDLRFIAGRIQEDGGIFDVFAREPAFGRLLHQIRADLDPAVGLLAALHHVRVTDGAQALPDQLGALRVDEPEFEKGRALNGPLRALVFLLGEPR